MPSALDPGQLGMMKDLLASRAKELRGLKHTILELETRIHEIQTQIHHLDEKSRVNREFLSTLSRLGKFTSHFRDKEVSGPARDLEQAERNIYKELVVVVANNRHSASTNLKEELSEEGLKLFKELDELRDKRTELQQKHDELSTCISMQYGDNR